MRLIKPTLRSWQHDMRERAALNGQRIKFVCTADDTLALLMREGIVVDTRSYQETQR
jgi:hypothetical protein